MPYARLLYIYDSEDETMKETAPYHSWRQGDVKEVGIRNGIRTLKYQLDKMLRDKWMFSKVVFFTHGNSGLIAFGKDRIDQDMLRRHFANRGYERLFPLPNTEMYFSGCNVAEGDAGWIFLEIVASIFLKTMGGAALGWTSTGWMVGSLTAYLIPILYLGAAGDPIHPTGDRRHVFVGPGGKFVKREEY